MSWTELLTNRTKLRYPISGTLLSAVCINHLNYSIDWEYHLNDLDHATRPIFKRHGRYALTHWSRVTHLRVSKLTIIGSDKGLSPGRHQAINWTNAGISLIWTWGSNFNEMLNEIHTFSFKKNAFERTGLKLENYYFFTFTFSRPEVRKLLLFYVFTFSRPEVRKLFRIYVFTFSRPEVRKLFRIYVFTFSRPEVRKLFRIYVFTFSRPEVGKLFRTFSFFLNMKLENYSIFRWRSARLQ